MLLLALALLTGQPEPDWVARGDGALLWSHEGLTATVRWDDLTGCSWRVAADADPHSSLATGCHPRDVDGMREAVLALLRIARTQAYWRYDGRGRWVYHGPGVFAVIEVEADGRFWWRAPGVADWEVADTFTCALRDAGAHARREQTP